jgi:hypothetical protein
VPNPKYPRSPSRVLTTAFKMAMAITLALARDRATGESKPLYFGQGNRIKGMARVWDEGKREYQLTVQDRHPDASVLLKREHSIRRSFSRILLKTSVRYGNTETKRVKREEGDRMYLNILWDYAGSQLRDVMKSRYEFSKPKEIKKIDETSGFGYKGTERIPFYPVRHNHLPELDLGDMIRSPLMELVRQCLKYGVPMKAARKYIDALLYRLIPFLDYVYTERRSGRSNYIRDGLKELRIVVELIKGEYGARNGVRQSITAEVQELLSEEDPKETDSSLDDTEESEDTAHFLEDAITAVKAERAVLDESLQTADKLLTDGILTAEDSEKLLREMQEQSRKIGVKIHRFVSKNFQSPFSINGVIYHGTEMAYDDSGLILLSEVPVDGGRGRVDFVLARVRPLTRVDGAPAAIICEPFMVVDLKTKSAFDFDIYGVESRTTDENNVVNKFILEHRGLFQEEWEDVLSNTPEKEEKTQLDLYESAILRDYKSMMSKDVDAPKSLAKAVLVVDSHQSWKDISKAVLPLVLSAFEGCVDDSLSAGDILFPSDGNSRLRIAMRMLSVSSPNTDTVRLSPPLTLNPFRHRVLDKKDFVLYLTVSGSGSPSQSAADIAERWHGLEYVYNYARRRHRDVFWLDLAGEYRDPVLREKQFRLKSQTNQIKRFFKDRVKMWDLSGDVRTVIYEGGAISSLHMEIHSLLKRGRNPIVVVSGWDALRRNTPDTHTQYLDEVVTTIIQTLPSRCTIVWFARPVPLAQSSIEYSSRCVAPYYQGTLWQNFVDSIVWNVPIQPNRIGARISTNHHERCVLIERPEKPLESKVIEVEPLRDWGKDFQSGGRKNREAYGRGFRDGSVSQQSGSHLEKQIEQAMKLIPHLSPQIEHPRSNFSLHIEKVSSGYDTQREDVPPRLTFRPEQIYTETEDVDGRVQRLLPIADINRRREYRQMELQVPYKRRTTVPPLEDLLVVKNVEDHKIALTETRNLRNIIRSLENVEDDHLRKLLDQLSEVLDNTNEENPSEDNAILMNRLRLIRQTLESNGLSERVWKQLLPVRSVIPRNLSQAQREHVTAIQTRHPDILLITGNYLLLLILSAIGRELEEVNRELLEALWDYVHPWHLMVLGFRPKYHLDHHTGRSVFDRNSLLPRLRQRLIESKRSLGLKRPLTDIKFGQVIISRSSNHLWLLFQRTPGIFDMNAALLSPRGIDSSLSPLKKLYEMVSGKTFWSESDLTRLSLYAKIKDDNDTERLKVMVAEQQGIQGLWVEAKDRWVPVGRVRYTTRRHEDATLVRTISLTADHHLQSADFDEVRRPIHRMEDMVSRALFIINKALDGCISVTCKVTLDIDERMFHVSFNESGSGDAVGDILINRTSDLFELLRRPDTECEPVIIDEKKLIWNRFRDISYDEDVALLRPWVDRRDPFPGIALKNPPSATSLINAVKEFDVTLELYHDSWTCPLRHISLEDIEKSHKMTRTLSGSQYMLRYESPWGEPALVSNEPGIHHGSCWRVHIVTPHRLTPELRELSQIRFTDNQARSLLSPQELVYWSEETQRWVTHTFKLVVQKGCIEAVKESWHLRLMLAELTGEQFELALPGVEMQNPDRWSSSITIEPKYVRLCLKEKDTRFEKEKIIPQQNVALMEKDEVQELLDREMSKLLKSSGITADRKLSSSIQAEIATSMEIAGVSDNKSMVQFDGVTIDQDSTGGRILYVVLILGFDVHKIPVTGHLHNIRQLGRYNREEFVSDVKDILDEFNLSDEDMDRAVKECIRVMREEKLITR